MKIFLTGATGFLGKHVLARLLSEGHEIGALARSAESENGLQALGAHVVRGSLSNVAEWGAQLSGYEAVIHCAAPVDLNGEWDRLYRDIAIATRDLLGASDQSGVKRFVYLSSESVILDGHAHQGVNEEHRPLRDPISTYGRAKARAEMEILKLKTKTEVVILRPAWIWGEGDSSVPKLVERVESGKFVWVNEGKTIIETVHVDNVVEAIVLALARGADRRPYFVTDDSPTTVREHFESILRAEGLRAPERNVPGWVARGLACVAGPLWKIARLPGHPPINRAEWAFVAVDRRYDSSRIRNELGFKSVVSREQGLRRLSATPTGGRGKDSRAPR